MARKERIKHQKLIEAYPLGEHFWARGYAVSAARFESEQVRQCIRELHAEDGASGQF